MQARAIEVKTHGRYLIRVPNAPGPWPLLVGFHGYKENAAAHLAVLETIPGTESWLIVAVQGLHRFYARAGDVVASWMTREDRELAIADNIEYVRQVVDAVRVEFAARDPLIFEGFSQGAAMAFRAAAQIRADGLIVVGGDVPADVLGSTPMTLPPVLYGRGVRDELYRAESHAADLTTLERLGVTVHSLEFDGGHALAPGFIAAAGAMISRFERP